MRAIAAVFLLTMLAGCKASGRIPVPSPRPVPPLVPGDAAPCPDPGVKPGIHLGTVLAKNRYALAECSRRHGRVVAQYQDVERRSSQ